MKFHSVDHRSEAEDESFSVPLTDGLLRTFHNELNKPASGFRGACTASLKRVAFYKLLQRTADE